MEIKIQKNIPLPKAAMRGRASSWTPIFDGLKDIGDSYKYLFTTTELAKIASDSKEQAKIESRIRQATLAYREKRGKHLSFAVRVVFKNPNPEMAESDPEADGSGIRIWRAADKPIEPPVVVTEPATTVDSETSTMTEPTE